MITQANRLPMVDTEPVKPVDVQVKPRSKRKSKKRATRTPRKLVDARLWRWATAGVWIMAALSSALNGYANSLHATIWWAGWGMGCAIPIIVLILGTVAGLLFKRKYKKSSVFVGLIGVWLLFLSVWHCATAIGLLTGSTLYLSMPMAIAIDFGFISCKVSALIDT